MSGRSKKKLDKNIKIKQISSGSLTSSGVVSSRNEIYEKIIERTGKVTELIPLDLLEQADPEWNYFPPLSEDKTAEMITSILNFGLMHPIIVWRQENGKYMILSGHNRVRAYEKILNNYNTNEEFRAFVDETYEDFNIDDYKKIEAIVYEDYEIDEYEAQNIIIDTNHVQREQTKGLEKETILRKKRLIEQNKKEKGRVVELVAKSLNLNASKVQRISALDKLPENIQQLYFDGRVSLVAIQRMLHLSPTLQQWVMEEYGDVLNTKLVSKITKNMDSKDKIRRAFNKYLSNDYVRVTFDVPVSLKEDFMKYASDWLSRRKQQEFSAQNS